MEATASAVVVISLVFGAFLAVTTAIFFQFFYARTNSVVWLRNQLASVLIQKYNRNIPLLSHQQKMLDLLHGTGIINQVWDDPRKPKRYLFVLSPKASRQGERWEHEPELNPWSRETK